VAMEQMVESLALHAASMHPQLFLLLDKPVAGLEAGDPMHGANLQASRPTSALTFREAPAASPAPPYDSGAGRSLGPSQPIEPKHSGWTAWILAIPHRLWAALLRQRDIGRSRRALDALDDRTLKDIGLSRCEVDRAVRQGRARY
jgi:uncharacterized protein YjiS (DUF1127 family)